MTSLSNVDLLEESRLCSSAGQWEAALRILERLKVKSEKQYEVCVDVFLRRAICLRHLGQYAEAREALVLQEAIFLQYPATDTKTTPESQAGLTGLENETLPMLICE